MLRSLYIGSLVADRDHYRSSRPGMKPKDYNRIEDPVERKEYEELCLKLRRVLFSMLVAIIVFRRYSKLRVHRGKRPMLSSPVWDSIRMILQLLIFP